MYILFIIFIILILYILSINKVEHYYNIAPYDYRWNIFKCYTSKCIRDKSKICYDICSTWPEIAGRDNCRLNCMDDGDLMYHYLKLNNYNFNKALPNLQNYSLLGIIGNDIDYVE